jgi:hypothetical protein
LIDRLGLHTAIGRDNYAYNKNKGEERPEKVQEAAPDRKHGDLLLFICYPGHISTTCNKQSLHNLSAGCRLVFFVF